ncbi:hypothetical protein INT43_003688 [Umbelopsis isabellina]|uniref:Uncharacterized protein n=1 Tax=Mortierella isabellina TaxID=91625 RepID=A0A8H7UFN1_MORIS|nr:hypothetical protein INT43_003688 [Umbelopsis isabellina]
MFNSSASPATRLVLSDSETSLLLDSLEWRYALTPTGELAPEAAMAVSIRPICHLVKRTDRFVTEITTQSNWTRNLVQNNVLWGNTDFDDLQVLAQCKMLFPHMMKELPLPQSGTSVRKILHLVQCETMGHFSLVNVMRAVKSLEQKLHEAVLSWPENKSSCYEALDKVFGTYGFLMPTKITLEDSTRSKAAFMVAKAQANKSLARINSMDELKGTHVFKPKADIIKRPYDILLYTSQEGPGTQFESWEIIKRTELQPIYEVLPTELGRKIQAVLYERANPIRVGDTIRLQNLANQKYLAWRLNEHNIEPGLCLPTADSSLLRLAQWRLRRSDNVKAVNAQVKYGHAIFIEAVLGPVDSDLCVLLSLKDDKSNDRQELLLLQNKDWNEDSSFLVEYILTSAEPETVDMQISKIKPLNHGDIIFLSQKKMARYLSSKKVDDEIKGPAQLRRRSSSFGSASAVISRIRRMSLTRSTIAMAASQSGMEWDKIQFVECGSDATSDEEKWIVLSDKANHFARSTVGDSSAAADLRGLNSVSTQPSRLSTTPRFITTGTTPIYRTSTGTDCSYQDKSEQLLDMSDQLTTTTDASSFSVSGITTVSLKSFRSASIPSPSMSMLSLDTRNDYNAPIFDLIKKKKSLSHRAKELLNKASLMSLRDIGMRFNK